LFNVNLVLSNVCVVPPPACVNDEANGAKAFNAGDGFVSSLGVVSLT